MENFRPVQQLRRSSRRRNRRAARLLLPRFTAPRTAAAGAAVWLCLAVFFAAVAMPIAGVAASATGSGYVKARKTDTAARSREGLGAAASDVITVTVDNYDKTVSSITYSSSSSRCSSSAIGPTGTTTQALRSKPSSGRSCSAGSTMPREGVVQCFTALNVSILP